MLGGTPISGTPHIVVTCHDHYQQHHYYHIIILTSYFYAAAPAAADDDDEENCWTKIITDFAKLAGYSKYPKEFVMFRGWLPQTYSGIRIEILATD